ncbi:MAG: ACP phosphodiesterase, partial [Pseudomonadota bacterium]
MNFLAHCALAWDAASVWSCHNKQRTGLLAGGILGDFVKGRVDPSWPIELQAGVRLHRKVDALSNRDPHTRACSNLFTPELRRLAPIFVDLLGDYHLANHWTEFYAIDLHQFTQECYASLGRYEAYLTEPGQRFYQYALDV